MILISAEERRWLLSIIAQALADYISLSEPVEVEELLGHPPQAFDDDFGLVPMFSSLWDATFARPPGQRGAIFVRVDLPPEQRRFALAREMLSAVISGRHGRRLGLTALFISQLREAAEFFACHLLIPDRLLEAFRGRVGSGEGLAMAFAVPDWVAETRWKESLSLVGSRDAGR